MLSRTTRLAKKLTGVYAQKIGKHSASWHEGLSVSLLLPLPLSFSLSLSLYFISPTLHTKRALCRATSAHPISYCTGIHSFTILGGSHKSQPRHIDIAIGRALQCNSIICIVGSQLWAAKSPHNSRLRMCAECARHWHIAVRLVACDGWNEPNLWWNWRHGSRKIARKDRKKSEALH